MRLYPAIDLRAGRCVRLYQGDYERETAYGDDPVSMAEGFVAAGASWLHIVDLDAALTGEPTNRSVIAKICAAVDVPVQVGGGVRSEAAGRDLIELGVTRIVIGTAALENPDLVEKLAVDHQVAVGLDARGKYLATHGWTKASSATVAEVANRFTDTGVDALVVTEIARDGTLSGPDVQGLSEILTITTIPVIASGGVGTLKHLEQLAATTSSAEERRFEGVIVGKAIYEGAFTVAEAIASLESDQ